MTLILFVLLLFVNVACVQAQKLFQNEFANVPMSAGATAHPSDSEIGSPVTDASIMQPHETSWRHRDYAAAPMFAGDH